MPLARTQSHIDRGHGGCHRTEYSSLASCSLTITRWLGETGTNALDAPYGWDVMIAVEFFFQRSSVPFFGKDTIEQ